MIFFLDIECGGCASDSNKPVCENNACVRCLVNGQWGDNFNPEQGTCADSSLKCCNSGKCKPIGGKLQKNLSFLNCLLTFLCNLFWLLATNYSIIFLQNPAMKVVLGSEDDKRIKS